MNKATIPACLSAMALAGCSFGEDLRICSPPPPEVADPTVRSERPVVKLAEECIHRSAYRLAKAPDDARTVADAVVGLCGEEISAQINALNRVNQDVLRNSAFVEERSRLVALSYVVQARAGRCSVPGPSSRWGKLTTLFGGRSEASPGSD
jgi:hypothetical protein